MLEGALMSVVRDLDCSRLKRSSHLRHRPPADRFQDGTDVLNLIFGEEILRAAGGQITEGRVVEACGIHHARLVSSSMMLLMKRIWVAAWVPSAKNSAKSALAVLRSRPTRERMNRPKPLASSYARLINS